MKKARQVTVPTDRPLTRQEADELLEHAYNSALWHVTNYARSKKQLKEKLYLKGYPRDAVAIRNNAGELVYCDLVNETIQRLEDSAVIDERRLVEDFIQSKQRAGVGEQRIRLLLMQKSISSDLVDEVFESVDPEAPKEALKKTLQRYVATSTFRNTEDDRKKKQKLFQHLSSKGFSFDDISSALQDYFDWD